MWIKRTVLGLGIVAVFAAFAPFLSSSLATRDETEALTHTVSRGDLSVVVTENGTLESSNNKEIKCFVKGGSTVLWVIETGTIVKPGDELVKLDTSIIEENITRQQIAYERAVANQIIAQSEVDVAKTNIEEYLNGTYLEERAAIEKEIFDATQLVKKAQLTYDSAVRMASKGTFKTLQLESEQFAVESARKALQLKEQQLSTLDKYKRKKTMQGLESALAAAEARYAAEEASLSLEKDRLDRDKEQLTNCVIRADTEGMVIFPSAAEWKETPDIEEGAVVREQQTLLMIPDVSKMQVKVGVHESKVDQLYIGMKAQVQLQDLVLDGEVAEIAEVTRPAGWWTGNMVKYDTIIRLKPRPGLKPGMSAVVDIILADHQDVVRIPVAAILQTDKEYYCWVKSATGIQRRQISLGGSNDEFAVVKSGLEENEEVILNPMAYVDDAQRAALRLAVPSSTGEPSKLAAAQASDDGTQASDDAKGTGDDEAAASEKKSSKKGNSATAKITGAQVIAMADKNKDGVLTEDEFSEKDRSSFPEVDTNGDGKVDAGELDAKIKAATGG